MKKITSVSISALLTACVNAMSPSPVNQLSPGIYEITRVGGWGFDLAELKNEVRSSAEIFATSAGKDMVIISEEVEPDEKVGTYPAYDDRYKLRFRLVEKK